MAKQSFFSTIMWLLKLHSHANNFIPASRTPQSVAIICRFRVCSRFHAHGLVQSDQIGCLKNINIETMKAQTTSVFNCSPFLHSKSNRKQTMQR